MTERLSSVCTAENLVVELLAISVLLSVKSHTDPTYLITGNKINCHRN